MKEYLEISNKTLASKQASKQASKHYAITDIGRAHCPVGANPCMGEAKASSVQGFFCSASLSIPLVKGVGGCSIGFAT